MRRFRTTGRGADRRKVATRPMTPSRRIAGQCAEWCGPLDNGAQCCRVRSSRERLPQILQLAYLPETPEITVLRPLGVVQSDTQRRRNLKAFSSNFSRSVSREAALLLATIARRTSSTQHEPHTSNRNVRLLIRRERGRTGATCNDQQHAVAERRWSRNRTRRSVTHIRRRSYRRSTELRRLYPDVAKVLIFSCLIFTGRRHRGELAAGTRPMGFSQPGHSTTHAASGLCDRRTPFGLRDRDRAKRSLRAD